MIEVQRMTCPDCGYEYDVPSYIGEEIKNSDIRLTRKSFQRTSWQEIDEICRSGNANLFFDTADKIDFTLKNGQRAAVNVLAVNPYGNGVAFGFTELLWKHKMNHTDTNRGGWACSSMLKFLEEDVLTLLPDDLQAVIKEREIVQDCSAQSLYKNKSKLWLPSFTEVFGKVDRYSSCDVGDVRFPYFESRMHRIKIDTGADTFAWWLRSPYVGNSTNFWYVYYFGYSNFSYASNAYGVCPCFII